MVLKTQTWQKQVDELAKREDARTFDFVEINDIDVALIYSNGKYQGELKGGQRAKWNPLKHDEIIWIALQPFEVNIRTSGFKDPTITLGITTKMKIDNPKVFVSTMLKEKNVTITYIEKWLRPNLIEIIKKMESLDESQIEQIFSKIKNKLNQNAKSVGLTILELFAPISRHSEQIVEALEDLKVAPLKKDNFNTRIDAILTALERAQKPEQEIRLHAIEAFKEWAKHQQPSTFLSYGYPMAGNPIVGGNPTVGGNFSSDALILNKLIEIFQKDTGSSKLADALKDILLDTDYMGLKKKDETKNELKISQDKIWSDSPFDEKINLNTVKIELKGHIEKSKGKEITELTIDKFKKRKDGWFITGDFQITETDTIKEKSFFGTKKKIYIRTFLYAFKALYVSQSNSIVKYRDEQLDML